MEQTHEQHDVVVVGGGAAGLSGTPTPARAGRCGDRRALTGSLSLHLAQLLRRWSDDLTLFLHTGPRPSGEATQALAARGIAVVEDVIAEDTRLVVQRVAVA